MNKKLLKITFGLLLLLTSCSVPSILQQEPDISLPENYVFPTDTSKNIAQTPKNNFFKDSYLLALIDSALKYNKELNIVLQEIYISRNEVSAKKGEYLPFARIGAEAEVEKVGRYTSQGANDANTEIEPGREFPEPLPNFVLGGFASWEIDVWRKLRNAKDAAVQRYLATQEGKNFLVTQIVAEIASTYYELLALDRKLELLDEYIQIQANALKIVRLQKLAGEVTELAVKRFEAELLSIQSLRYEVLQEITEKESYLNFLLGRYPRKILRNPAAFSDSIPEILQAGFPTDLLFRRPDIRQAEKELQAAKLDLKSAKAFFYPSLELSAKFGWESFNPLYFSRVYESLLYGIAGGILAPLVNKNEIKARYLNANAKQMQAVLAYEQALLNAYREVYNEISNLKNLLRSYAIKRQEVAIMNQSVDIAMKLFKAAKADYMEVLITQRDALEARLELIEYQKSRWVSYINLYRKLGGGWE